MKKLFLIDASALIYRSFHALPPLTSPAGEPVNALYGLSNILLKIFREERPDYAAALFDRPEPTFRKKEYTEYKAQRPKAADELVSQIVKSRELFKKFGVRTFEAPGFEADDLIGAYAEKFGKEKDLKIVILTGDLDTLQLVVGNRVVVKTLRTGVSDTIVYDEGAVFARYGLSPKQLPDYKALAGDNSDNIPGLKGVGSKTASELIKKYGNIEGLYSHLDNEPKIKEKYGNQKADAFLFRKLALIRRDAPSENIKLEDLAVREFGPELGEYFASLGFTSLVKRLGAAGVEGEPAVAAKPKRRAVAPGQALGLFGATPQAELAPAPVVSVGGRADFLVLSADESVLKLSPKDVAGQKLKAGFELKRALKLLLRKKQPVAGPYFDFGVAAWLLEPDQKKYDPDSVAKKLFGRDFGGPDDLAALYSILKKKLGSGGLLKIFEDIEMPLIEVLAEMELSGIGINRKILDQLAADIKNETKKVAERIYKAAGSKINLNSPKQLSALLFERLKIGDAGIKKTPTGLRSTNIETLTELKGRHKIIDELIYYREIFKLYSTYVEPIRSLTEADGRLRTEFIQTGTATGRLSSQNPNLQNIPAPSSDRNDWANRLRGVFAAKKGCRLAAFDYSQLELRVLASVSGDERMIGAFRRGEDIHTATAAAVFGVPVAGVEPGMRRLAKTLNFGIIFGMGSEAFSKTAEIPRNDAKRFIESYFALYPGIRSWHEKIKQEGRANGLVRNLNGRLRRTPGITYGRSRLAAEAERIAINMPIQSMEADIIKLAMLGVRKKFKEWSLWGSRVTMLLSIHDELLFEIEEGIINDVSVTIRNLMEAAFVLRVPLIVKVKFGPDLAAMEEA